MILINLNKQIYLYSVDTSAFYNQDELLIHGEINQTIAKRNELKKKIRPNEDKEALLLEIKQLNDNFKHLKKQLSVLLNKNDETRLLNQDALKETNVVAMFDSILSRTFGIAEKNIQTDIFIVRIYFFEVLKNIMDDGFMYNGNKYVYFTSSAGQIRTKKTIFIRESLFDKHKESLMCGLSVNEINKRGGANANKFLAYLSLCNGATEPIFERRMII